MGSFLDNLKNDLDKGEFNSEAAKKINEIAELADLKIGKKTNVTSNIATPELDKLVSETGVKTVSKEEADRLNSEYEKKMEELKQIDLNNQLLAKVEKQIDTLKEIDETIKLCVEDLYEFIKETEEVFDKNEPKFSELYKEINKLKNNYNKFLNKD